jgi:hypothetical protein
VLLVLLATATVNLLTKQVATISGLVFTAAFFTLFTISERVAKRKREGTGLDQFQLIREEKIDLDVVQVRAAPVLVTVRDYKTLKQLTLALSETDTKENDVVVMTARIIQGSAAGYREIFDEHLFTEFEQLLFTRVVATAEKMGKPVKLLTVPSNNPFAATVNTAVRLGCIRMYAGASEKLSITTQARLVGKAWEEIDDPDKTQFEFVIVGDQGEPHRFQIGAHAPDLAPEDIELIHRIWLEITEKVPEGEFHHRDVVSLALNRFNQEFKGPAGAQILDELKKSSKKPVRKKTRTRF